MNQKFKKYFPPLIGILAVFAVWYIVCRAGILSSYVLPSPGRVFQSFCKMLQSGKVRQRQTMPGSSVRSASAAMAASSGLSA